MDQIRGYRFGPPLLLKNPLGSEYSTRGPALVKNNYGLVLFLANRPLSFLNFEPAVLLLFFYELDPGSIV